MELDNYDRQVEVLKEELSKRQFKLGKLDYDNRNLEREIDKLREAL